MPSRLPTAHGGANATPVAASCTPAGEPTPDPADLVEGQDHRPRERKWYAPGVVVVFEETVQRGSGTLSLVELTSLTWSG